MSNPGQWHRYSVCVQLYVILFHVLVCVITPGVQMQNYSDTTQISLLPPVPPHPPIINPTTINLFCFYNFAILNIYISGII